MTTPDCLKLLALDDEDLAVIAAHTQDAVMKVADLQYLPREGRFVLEINRFIWEKAEGGRKTYERRRTALVFDRVKAVRRTCLRQDSHDAVLDLLTITFEETDAPGGNILLVFAGGAAIRLEVECIEARLADLGTAWATRAMPQHELDAAAERQA